MAARVSLRRRLLALLLGTVTASWGLATVATYVDTHRETDRLLDAHLAQAATLLVAQTGHELLEIETEDLPDGDDYGQGVTFQAWEGGTRLLVRSDDAPGVHLGTGAKGFADTTIGERRWRVFSNWDKEHTILIEVAEDHAVRERIAARVALNSLVPMLATLPVLGLLVWWSVGRALAPLESMGEQIRARDAHALEPLPESCAPREAQPLVERLNELFARIRSSAELERRFTADAAHELRKPVAAVRAQAEVARTTRSTEVRQHALDQVIAACERMAKLIEQLLTLARLEGVAGSAPDRQNLATIVRQVIADLAPGNLAEGRDIGLEASGDAYVSGHPELLTVLVRNLVTNALVHGGTGAVDVHLGSEAHEVTLTVEDCGPGVPAAEFHHLGERFWRGSAQGPGSGLGLSIVRRIAAMHEARLEFSAGAYGRGLRVSVTFPEARTPA